MSVLAVKVNHSTHKGNHMETPTNEERKAFLKALFSALDELVENDSSLDEDDDEEDYGDITELHTATPDNIKRYIDAITFAALHKTTIYESEVTQTLLALNKLRAYYNGLHNA